MPLRPATVVQAPRRVATRAMAMVVCGAGAMLVLAILGPPLRAEPWGSVFAAETDSAYFLLESGVLVRAPFHLNSRDTLWICPRAQHVVRLLGSPRGGRLAWLSRGLETDTTRLWIASPERTELRLRYFTLQAKRHGQTYSEVSWATTADETVHGARLLSSTYRPQGQSSNALAWTPGGRSLLVAYDGGIANVAPGTQGVPRVSGHRALRLRPLYPSAVLMADALDSASVSSRVVTQLDLKHALDMELSVKDGHVADVLERREMLLRPGPGGLVECKAERWMRASVRTTTASTLWWAEGRTVYGIHAVSGSLAATLRAPSRVEWLACDATGRRLLGVSGRILWRAEETGDSIAPVLEAASEVRAVLRSVGGESVALFEKDSVLLWNEATGEIRRLRHTGAQPDLVFVGEGGRVVFVGGVSDKPVTLARAEPGSGALIPEKVPSGPRRGSIIAGPRGAWVLSCAIGRSPPDHLYAYDVNAGAWHKVENPGIIAWEALRH